MKEESFKCTKCKKTQKELYQYKPYEPKEIWVCEKCFKKTFKVELGEMCEPV